MTDDFARKHGKPPLHLHPGIETPGQELAAFIRTNGIKGFERGRPAAFRRAKDLGIRPRGPEGGQSQGMIPVVRMGICNRNTGLCQIRHLYRITALAGQ
jgi:hypothetical protein